MRFPLLLFLLISHRYQRNIHLCAIFGSFTTREEVQKEKMGFALIQLSEEFQSIRILSEASLIAQSLY